MRYNMPAKCVEFSILALKSLLTWEPHTSSAQPWERASVDCVLCLRETVSISKFLYLSSVFRNCHFISYLQGLIITLKNSSFVHSAHILFSDVGLKACWEPASNVALLTFTGKTLKAAGHTFWWKDKELGKLLALLRRLQRFCDYRFIDSNKASYVTEVFLYLLSSLSLDTCDCCSADLQDFSKEFLSDFYLVGIDCYRTWPFISNPDHKCM